MKILFIGDPHIKNDNHEEIDILITQLKIVCEQHKFDRIVIAGDLMHYHERIFTQSLNKSLEFVSILSHYAPLDVIVGNHDMINNQQFLTSNHWLNVLKHDNITVIEKPSVQVIDGFKIVLCPYVYPGRFMEALEHCDWKTSNVIFAHQEFKGCKMGAIVSKEGDEWNETFPQVISGHIHDNQRPQQNIYYPGSPLQHSFGDTDKRVVCYIDELGKIVDIPLDVPKKRIVTTTLKNLNVSSLDSKSALKIKLSATPEEFKMFKQTSEYKTCIEKGIKVQLKVATTERKTMGNKPFKILLDELVVTDGDPLLKKLYTDLERK